jgi:hypothetical protein
MDSCLVQKVPVSLPPWIPRPAPTAKGYTDITSLTPILATFLGSLPTKEGALASDTQISQILELGGSGACVLETTKGRIDAYCKVTHLIDPTRTLQNYYTNPEKGVKRRSKKLATPTNQAYVDGLANYLLGQLRERGISPHFCLSYGSYKAVAGTYRYNITEDYESYRKYRIFWERRRAGLFALHVPDGSVETTPSSSLRSSTFSYDTTRSDKSHETIGQNDVSDTPATVELESVDSFPSGPADAEDKDDEDEEDEEDEDDEEDEQEVFAEFKDYPVLLIFQEHMEGVLDDLLEDEKEVGAPIGSDRWEEIWTAWVFQIIAALCAAQGALGFTHNDLHTNNIVWTRTDEEFLCYVARDGTVWRVPTFGRIFRIIDFGRAIYRVGETWFVSDDYAPGGDAAGQYNLAALRPNPSFDLCRLSVSLIDTIFPEPPVERLDGQVLSKEKEWIVYETDSPLWNLLWSWLIDDNGRNVLREEDGEERYPDFDLYQQISAHVRGAKPQEQIRRSLFDKYHVSREKVGKVYPLFC